MNKNYILATMLSLAVAHVAVAGDAAPSTNVSVDARVSYEADKYSGDSNVYDDIRTDDINVTLTADLSSKIRAKIRANLADLFVPGAAKDKLEHAIEEATIEIREINGTPIAAVIFGKEQVFGDLSNKDMAGYKGSLLYRLFTEDQVIGLTVQLKDIMGFALSASAFGNSSGALQFGDGWGFSASASRQLTANIRLRASAMAMDKNGEGDTSFSDRRATVGLVYTSDDGKYAAALDGLYFDGQDCWLSNKHWAVKATGTAKVGPGTVRVEASYLEQAAYELAAAYDLQVNDNLVVSPTVRYVHDTNSGDSETRAMVEARVRTGNNPQQVK